MGLGGISPMSLLLILIIVVCLFGTKKLRNVGYDLGHAIRSFREGMRGEERSTNDTNKKLTDDTEESK